MSSKGAYVGAGKSVQAAAGGTQEAAKRTAQGAQQAAKEQQAAPDVGKQLNKAFGGFKLPWQKNGAQAQSQQVILCLLCMVLWPYDLDKSRHTRI